MQYNPEIPFVLLQDIPEQDLMFLGTVTCLSVLYLENREDLYLTHPDWGSLLLSPGQCIAAKHKRPVD